MFQQADEDRRRASFTPFAARTQQYVKESLGGNVEKVGLKARQLRGETYTFIDSTAPGLH